MAYRITRNQDDAEDVIQDAWMRAYVHLKTSMEGRSFRLGSRVLPSILRLGFSEGFCVKLQWQIKE
jgi:hypothetical protein